jgi:hypothetical protein
MMMMMNLKQFGEKTKWWGLMCGAIFLAVSSYMRWKFVFEPGPTAGVLLIFSMSLAVLTLASGLLSIPRWQPWIALAVFCYALYRVFFARLFAYGHPD